MSPLVWFPCWYTGKEVIDERRPPPNGGTIVKTNNAGAGNGGNCTGKDRDDNFAAPPAPRVAGSFDFATSVFRKWRDNFLSDNAASALLFVPGNYLIFKYAEVRMRPVWVACLSTLWVFGFQLGRSAE